MLDVGYSIDIWDFLHRSWALAVDIYQEKRRAWGSLVCSALLVFLLVFVFFSFSFFFSMIARVADGIRWLTTLRTYVSGGRRIHVVASII